MNIGQIFKKKKTFKDTVTQVINKPKKERQKKSLIRFLQHLLLYVAIFLAGYLAAKIQILFTKI